MAELVPFSADAAAQQRGVNSLFDNENNALGSFLEAAAIDSFAGTLKLPQTFRSSCPLSNPEHGHGMMQKSSEDAVIMAIKAARNMALKNLLMQFPSTPKFLLNQMLVSYSNEQSAHLGEKGAILAGIAHKTLKPNENGNVTEETLLEAISQDKTDEKIPIFFLASFGSANMGVFDDLKLLGPICQENNIWIHADASVGAVALMSESNSYINEGLKYASSLHVDLEIIGLQLEHSIIQWFKYNLAMLKGYDGEAGASANNFASDFAKKARSLQTFLVLNMHDAESISFNGQTKMFMAKRLQDYMIYDKRFEVFNIVRVPVISFRLTGTNVVNHIYIQILRQSQFIQVSPVYHSAKLWVRVSIGPSHGSYNDIDQIWEILKTAANAILSKVSGHQSPIEDEEIKAFVDHLTIPSGFHYPEEIIREYQILNPFQSWNISCIEELNQYDQAPTRSSDFLAPAISDQDISTPRNDSDSGSNTSQACDKKLAKDHVIRNFIGEQFVVSAEHENESSESTLVSEMQSYQNFGESLRQRIKDDDISNLCVQKQRQTNGKPSNTGPLPVMNNEGETFTKKIRHNDISTDSVYIDYDAVEGQLLNLNDSVEPIQVPSVDDYNDSSFDANKRPGSSSISFTDYDLGQEDVANLIRDESLFSIQQSDSET